MQINNKLYLFDSNGVMQTGWISSADFGDTSDTPLWMYADENGALVVGDWKKIDGKWYYFQKYDYNYYYGYGAGPVMVTGLYDDNEAECSYYFNKYGVMQTGWIKVGSDYYYANGKGVLQTGWQTIGGKHYFFMNNYEMVTGFYYDEYENRLYYFDSNGVCQNFDNPYKYIKH